MTNPTRRMTFAALFAAGLVTGRPAVAQTPPPSHDHAAMVRAAAPASAAARGYTDADVAFMQGMIPHHAQALDMTALVQARTTNPGFRLFTERIEVSQRDEIVWMQHWLRTRGQTVPEVGPGHDHGTMHHLMPGMLTPEQMAELAAATGVAFERKFLVYMIQHHEGALMMVDTLFASPGAGQATEVYTIATDIDADQRADIQRMRWMLAALPPDPTPAPAGAAPHRH